MKVKLFLLMILAASSLSAQNKLTIVVDGIEKVKGHLIIAVYDKDSFMKSKPLAASIVEIKDETVTVELDSIPPGEYAVTLFQDENDNKKLDTGAYGIPTEKYGFSNNAVGKMGPPSFDDCMFAVKEDTVIYITVM